jgi:hypothetical protein
VGIVSSPGVAALRCRVGGCVAGEINYKLEQIVRPEPDAGLFRVLFCQTLQKLPNT